MTDPTDDPAAFVRANTTRACPPLVPEIMLHLASEVMPLWTRTEAVRRGVLPPPYWAFAWSGGQALARYILDRPAELRGKTVLDFGAGSGLVAIAAVMAGARATAAEIDALSIAAMTLNAQANGVSLDIVANDIIGSACLLRGLFFLDAGLRHHLCASG